MDTKITKVEVDWVDIKNECRSTVNKEATGNIPSSTFISKLLISEHSPIRLARIKWRWEGIKSWVSVHFARHWLGWDKWVSTQRSDRTGVNRDKAPQDTPVNMDICANTQALINVSRFRLCNQAATETRQAMEDVKKAIYDCGQIEIASVLQPNCIYRGGCPEFQSCGRWEKFCKDHKDEDLLNIENRYKLANEEFFGGKNEI